MWFTALSRTCVSELHLIDLAGDQFAGNPITLSVPMPATHRRVLEAVQVNAMLLGVRLKRPRQASVISEG